MDSVSANVFQYWAEKYGYTFAVKIPTGGGQRFLIADPQDEGRESGRRSLLRYSGGRITFLRQAKEQQLNFGT